MPKSYTVEITTQAKEQVFEIVNYISKDLQAPDLAKVLLDEMLMTINKLSLFPKRNKAIDTTVYSKKIRKLIFKNYYIYYYVDDTLFKVQVIAVIPSMREQGKLILKILENT